MASHSYSNNSLILDVHENFANNDQICHEMRVIQEALSNESPITPRYLAHNNNNSDIAITGQAFPKSFSSITGGDKTSIASSAPTQNFFSNFDENGYIFDGVKVEIEDIDNTSISNITTQSLKRCKKQVFKHYYSLLCFIGWRPFYKEHFYRIPWCCKLFNVIYPIIIFCLLLYSYIYDIIICQGKLNVAIDTQETIPFVPAATIPPPVSESTRFSNYLYGTHSNLGSFPEMDEDDAKPQQCGHIVTTYIVPSLMHLASYIMGFIYFRINENEQLYALMEKVFLAHQSLKVVSQDRVIRRLRMFMFGGALWVVMAMGIHILFRAVYGLEKEMLSPSWLLISIQAVALIIVNSIYLAVVINYATQCEMIIFYVTEVKTRLEEKSVPLKDAMQQILDVRMAIGKLNSSVSKMATLVALTFTEKFLIGFIILVLNRVFSPLAWTYRALFPLSWLVILVFCLTQVTRLNSKCDKFKQIALSSRVYGYHGNSREDLDSFILFVSNTKLRAKLFGVEIKASYLLGTLILVSFALILLFQTSVITPSNYFI